MSSLATKLKTAARHPELVGTRVRSRWNLVPYFVGDGSNAFTPSTVYVSVNSVCNMKCKMCDVGTATVGSQFWLNLLGPKSEISLENAKRIVDDVKSFKPVLAINSTEPLLYRHIVPMVEHAKAAGLEVQITTNGLRLEKFAEQFVDIGLDRLWISIDGPAAVHDHIRGVKNGFQRITDAIKLLTELKRQRGKATPRVFINFTVSEYNFDQAVPLMEAISGIGISGVTVSHMNFVTEAMADVHNGMYGHVVKATPSSVTLADPQRIELTALGDQIDELRAR
ncbi:MAG: radical SAM protein, partial [Chloroflexi bacterium]|nr:radical SAM protein [Chloroflexota bacterium]